MNNTSIKIAQKHEIISLYAYENTPGHTLSVYIAESIALPLVEDLKKLKLSDTIFLTIEDIMRGGDVFGVVLLHILARAECVYGENILQDIKYDHDQIRTSLEAHLRHFLIDLREQIIVWSDVKTMKNKLIVTCDRIWCGLHWYLNGKTTLSYESVEEFLGDLDHDWTCDLSWLRTMIHADTIDLLLVHQTLLGLLHKIDTMSENWIK